MSHIDGVEEINGRLRATARNIEAPHGWTTDFDSMGGESVWGPNGDIDAFLDGFGVDRSGMMPLYTTNPITGQCLTLFEAGSPTTFYIYSTVNGTLAKITGLETLEDIVDCIGDENKGLEAIKVEEIS